VDCSFVYFYYAYGDSTEWLICNVRSCVLSSIMTILVECFPQKVITYCLFADFLRLHSLKFLFIFIKVAKGMACFRFPKSGAYLTSGDIENGLSGLSGDPTVEELYGLQGGSESDWNVAGSGIKVKGRKKCSARDIVSLDFPYIFFPSLLKAHCMSLFSGFGGLEVACWPLVPKFAGSHPAEAVRFLGRKNPQHVFLQRGSKAVGPIS